MNEPYRNVLWFTVNVSLEKSGLPAIAAMSGVIRSATSAVTTAVNAVPMTTATASSMQVAPGDEVSEALHVHDPQCG